MNQNQKWLMALGVLVLVVVLGWTLWNRPSQTVNPAPETSGENQAPAPSGGEQPVVNTGTNTAPKPTTPKPTTAKGVTNVVVTPTQGEEWVMLESNIIRWSKAAGSNGEIILLDQNSKTVGWIAPSLTERQATYSWNGTSVLLSRTSSEKKEIAPGVYKLKIAFDGAAPDIMSGTFTLKRTGTAVSLTKMITIKNSVLAPILVEMKLGERLVFLNVDTTTRTITQGAAGVAKLGQNEAYVFTPNPGTYEYRLAENAVAGVTVTVK